MFKRKRRRSSFARRSPTWVRPAAIGAAVVVAIGLFVFFVRQADVLAPEQHVIRVEVPDAFKQ